MKQQPDWDVAFLHFVTFQSDTLLVQKKTPPICTSGKSTNCFFRTVCRHFSHQKQVRWLNRKGHAQLMSEGGGPAGGGGKTTAPMTTTTTTLTSGRASSKLGWLYRKYCKQGLGETELFERRPLPCLGSNSSARTSQCKQLPVEMEVFSTMDFTEKKTSSSHTEFNLDWTQETQGSSIYAARRIYF